MSSITLTSPNFFNVADEEALKYQEIAVTSKKQFKIKSVFLNDFFETSRKTKPMLEHVFRLPYKEIITTPAIFRFSAVKNLSSDNFYTSSEITIDKTYLSRPFETNCIDYEQWGFYGQHHCIEYCVSSQILTSFGKASTLSIVTQPSNLVPYTLDDLQDEETRLKLWKIQDLCESQCSHSECHDEEIVVMLHLIFTLSQERLQTFPLTGMQTLFALFIGVLDLFSLKYHFMQLSKGE